MLVSIFGSSLITPTNPPPECERRARAATDGDHHDGPAHHDPEQDHADHGAGRHDDHGTLVQPGSLHAELSRRRAAGR